MTRKAKILSTGLMAALLLMVIAVATVHIALTRRLAQLVRESILPQAKRALGVEVMVEDARVNIFKGALNVSGVQIGNPPAFQGPAMFSASRLELNTALRSLGRGVVRISEARADDARITIIRNAGGEVNVQVVRDRLAAITRKPTVPPKPAPEKQPPSEPPPASGTAVESRRIPRISTGLVKVSGLVEYIDYTFEGEPLRLSFTVLIETEDLSTFEQPDGQWGKIYLAGHLADDPDHFRIDLSGRIAPLTDPGRPTFDVVAHISSVDLARIDRVMKKTGYTADSVALTAPLCCNKGIFDKAKSRLTLHVKNARPFKAKHKGGIALPPDFSLNAALSGPLGKPTCNFTAGLIEVQIDSAASLMIKSLGDELEKADDGSDAKSAPGQRSAKARDEAAADTLKTLEELLKK